MFDIAYNRSLDENGVTSNYPPPCSLSMLPTLHIVVGIPR